MATCFVFLNDNFVTHNCILQWMVSLEFFIVSSLRKPIYRTTLWTSILRIICKKHTIRAVLLEMFSKRDLRECMVTRMSARPYLLLRLMTRVVIVSTNMKKIFTDI